MACSLWYVRFLETNSWYVPNYLLQICFGTLKTTFISVLSLAIQNLSLTLQQFQWA